MKATWDLDPRRVRGVALGTSNAVYSSLSTRPPGSLLPSSSLISGRFDYPEEIKYFYIKLCYNKYWQMLVFSVVPSVSVN